MYTPHSINIILNSVNCRIENFQCHMSDCKSDVNHMLVKSNFNININHIKLTKLKENNIFLNVIFSCDDHMMANISAVFYSGGYLNNHYTRQLNTNNWVHFKDCYYWIDPIDLDLNEQNILFILHSKNYINILSENPDILFQKLNNYFYFGGSLHKSGFCTICNIDNDKCEYYVSLKSRDYINREQPNAFGLNFCKCGHPKKVHYIDNEWDEYLYTCTFEDLKWPINLYNERGINCKVIRKI